MLFRSLRALKLATARAQISKPTMPGHLQALYLRGLEWVGSDMTLVCFQQKLGRLACSRIQKRSVVTYRMLLRRFRKQNAREIVRLRDGKLMSSSKQVSLLWFQKRIILDQKRRIRKKIRSASGIHTVSACTGISKCQSSVRRSRARGV